MGEKGLQQAAKSAFVGLGEGLNDLCAEDRSPLEEPDDIWIPTEGEADGVGKPTGRLIARRLPELPGGDANDAADIIAALIPLGLWAVRGLAELLPRIARHRRQLRAVARAKQEAEGGQ